MKTKICTISVEIILFFFFVCISHAQQDNAYLTTNNCAMCNSNNSYYFPIKPPVTGDNYLRILIVYVMFNGETYDPDNSIWPANTTTGPSYKGTMLAELKNSQTNWWNSYNPETQSVSSWFCENSRGQSHVIGTEYFVKLNTVNHYMRTYSTSVARENAINSEIYDSLNSQGVVWSNYDKWSYDFNNGGILWNSDHNIDMIYKVHRYKYSELFSEGSASGYSYLGHGSNTPNDTWDYQILQNGQIYHILGGFTSYGGYGERDGSGLTVVGNSNSGVLTKMGVFTRLIHENGHWFFGSNHGNLGVMGDVFDYSFSPFEKVALGYASPYVSGNTNNGYEQVILDDVSGRTSGNYMLRVCLPYGDDFLLASRYKISNWDRQMLGDTAHGYRTNTNYGEGTYIYHVYGYYNPNRTVDIECADGLWKWTQNGYAAPDWDPNNPWLCVLNKTEPERNQNDDGVPTLITSQPNIAKDGLSVRGHASNDNLCEKWFSVGKKQSQQYGDGTDRIFATETENWTSREFQVDRWDAWRPHSTSSNFEEIGVNEIFSPYSSPSTIGWDGQSTGTFIWIYSHNNQSNQTTVKIFRDAEINTGGMSESAILEATPPSRPMGIKLEYTECENLLKHPVIKWVHNTEPDMKFYQNNIAYKKYKIYRADDYYNGHIPGNYYNIITVDIPASDPEPSYTDYTATVTCEPSSQVPNYQLRYFVKAVDNTNWASVPSDFVGTEAREIEGNGDHLGSVNGAENTPKTFSLNQNYPNPFNPTTTINYAIPSDSKVSILVYDITGKNVKTLVDGFKTAGYYSVVLNGSDLSSGIYFYRIAVGGFVQTKRMVLIK